MQPNPVDTFLQEADDLLTEIEAAALSLAASVEDNEVIHRIFRAFHTIKGSGAMFGFTEVADFTHYVENLLDKARSGEVPVSAVLSQVILEATDHIKLLLASSQGGAPVDSAAQTALLEKVRVLANEPASKLAAATSITHAKLNSSEPEVKTWTIHFRPEPSILATGGNPVLLFRDLKKLGECIIHGDSGNVPSLSELQPETCYLRWTIKLTTTASQADIQDVFLFVEDGSELAIVTEAEHASKEQVTPAVEAPASTSFKPEAKAAQSASQSSAAPSRESTVRVPSSKLDRLVNLVGELVMNRARLASAVSRYNSPDLLGPVEEIERLVAELRDDVLQIRMMPIGSIFGRFRRLVHDLSVQLGKEIQIITEGEETELDKSILDQLGEPLVHLLRNSIDHGVEPPADRMAKGKPSAGTIRLTATHRGSDVVVKIEDDGAGLNRAAIKAKAIAKGIISADANLSDKEIINLILLPGFSTAQAITSVSGRGVGMDVVKRQIDALRGTLTLASEPGQGTSINLTLPLTLAIIDGLLVEVADSQFIIPMAVVTENVELSRVDRVRNNGRNLIAVRGELIPYIDLREVFAIEGAGPAVSKIVLVRYEDQRIGIVLDRVMGTHQTVIQALGKFFHNIEVVSGSTVMGDGRVALILDVAGVVRLAERKCQGFDLNAISTPQAAA